VRTVKPSPVVTLLVGTNALGFVWFPFEAADGPKGLRGDEELDINSEMSGLLS